jgi:hypothetical protein
VLKYNLLLDYIIMKGNKHDLIIILVLNLILLSRLINTLVWQRDAAHRTRHTDTAPAAERARIPPVARGHVRVIDVTSRARGCGGSVPDHVPVRSGLAAACACACAFAFVSTA